MTLFLRPRASALDGHMSLPLGNLKVAGQEAKGRRPTCPRSRQRRGRREAQQNLGWCPSDILAVDLAVEVRWRAVVFSRCTGPILQAGIRSHRALLVALPTLALGLVVASPASGTARAALSTANIGVARAACRPHPVDDVIPGWASSGFHPAAYRMYYELGRSDRIVALLWAHPLRSPQSPRYFNKILWVSRLPVNGSPMLIRAQQMKGTHDVGMPVTETVVGGPGPSYVNMPSPGCWRMTLTWSGYRDSLDWATSGDRQGS